MNYTKPNKQTEINISHRKENAYGFKKEYALINCNSKKTLIIVRLYETASMYYVVIWDKITNTEISMSTNYKPSWFTYINRCFLDLGYELPKEVTDMQSPYDTLEAIAKYWKVENYLVHKANA